jgi:hypothetical protein
MLEMTKILFLIAIPVLLILALTSQSVYSASSLEELAQEAASDTAYRTELENYIFSHNITIAVESLPDKQGYINSNNVQYFDTETLELVVKFHMQQCATQNKGDVVEIPAVMSSAIFRGTC